MVIISLDLNYYPKFSRAQSSSCIAIKEQPIFIQINHQNRSWAPEKLSNLLPPCSWGSAWLSNLLQWSLVIPNHRCCNTPSSTKASDQPIDLCVWRPNYNSSTSWRLNNTTESLEVGEVAEVVENVRLEVSNRSLYRGNGGCTREIISDGNPEPQLSGLPACLPLFDL